MESANNHHYCGCALSSKIGLAYGLLAINNLDSEAVWVWSYRDKIRGIHFIVSRGT